MINPRQNHVLVYRSAMEPDRLLKLTDQLDGEEIIPGFSLPVSQLFQSRSLLGFTAILDAAMHLASVGLAPLSYQNQPPEPQRNPPEFPRQY